MYCDQRAKGIKASPAPEPAGVAGNCSCRVPGPMSNRNLAPEPSRPTIAPTGPIERRTMLTPLLALLTLAPMPAPVESRFAQVHPMPVRPDTFERRSEQRRVVVLIHGLRMHPISRTRVEQAEFRTWQQPGSRLVLQLGSHADVFAFAYGQNAPVEQIAMRTGLPERVRLLVQMGYRDVVLVGHSAGGLIARHLVEDHPDLGV